jgi:hypothetical protein
VSKLCAAHVKLDGLIGESALGEERSKDRLEMLVALRVDVGDNVER